jgi:hypothetical protein
MAGPRRIIDLPLDEDDLVQLESIARSRTSPASWVERARILLAYRADPSSYAVGEAIGVTHQTVLRVWRVQGIVTVTGSGGPAPLARANGVQQPPRRIRESPPSSTHGARLDIFRTGDRCPRYSGPAQDDRPSPGDIT